MRPRWNMGYLSGQNQRNPQEAGKPPTQRAPKAAPMGPLESTPEDHPAKTSNTQPRAGAHQRKGHPGHVDTHPTGAEMGKKKTIGAAQARREGGTETKSPKSGRGSGGHHKATKRQGRKPQPPPQPGKKKGGVGGQTPATATPAHPHTTDSPTRRWRETDAAHARGHAPQHPNLKRAECRQNPTHTHTHTTPPGVAGYKRSTHANTHTPQYPSQEWRGAAKTRAQAHTPTPHTGKEWRGTGGARTQTHTHPNAPAGNGGA